MFALYLPSHFKHVNNFFLPGRQSREKLKQSLKGQADEKLDKPIEIIVIW